MIEATLLHGRGLPRGNCNDITQLIPLLEAVPAVAGVRAVPGAGRGESRRRSGLRTRQVPASAAQARDQAAHRTCAVRARLRARARALDGQTHLRPPAQLQAYWSASSGVATCTQRHSGSDAASRAIETFCEL